MAMRDIVRILESHGRSPRMFGTVMDILVQSYNDTVTEGKRLGETFQILFGMASSGIVSYPGTRVAEEAREAFIEFRDMFDRFASDLNVVLEAVDEVTPEIPDEYKDANGQVSGDEAERLYNELHDIAKKFKATVDLTFDFAEEEARNFQKTIDSYFRAKDLAALKLAELAIEVFLMDASREGRIKPGFDPKEMLGGVVSYVFDIAQQVPMDFDKNEVMNAVQKTLRDPDFQRHFFGGKTITEKGEELSHGEGAPDPGTEMTPEDVPDMSNEQKIQHYLKKNKAGTLTEEERKELEELLGRSSSNIFNFIKLSKRDYSLENPWQRAELG